MLLGTYAHSLDAKNRIIIPSKLMEELKGRLYIYPAASGTCIKLYDEAEWNKYCQMIEELPPEKKYLVKERIFPVSQQVTPDTQNRVPLPPAMLEKVGIASKSIVTVGMGTCCEIWSQEKYEARQATPPSPEIAAFLESMGF